MPYGSVNVDSLVGSSGGSVAPDSSVFRNRIINGAMVIDQRNAGASVTGSIGTAYTVDRFFIRCTQASKLTAQQNAGSVTPPVGFTNYLGITSSSAYSVVTDDFFVTGQVIEGFNTADFQWGTANAKTITLSFWVRSSLTGTFGGSLLNSGGSRCYPFSYTISSANTWEQKSIIIVGDTSGTWLTTNGQGIYLSFGLGVGATYSGTAGSWSGTPYFSATGATSVVGTSGATFYITGVQLEKGSTATSFDYRPYGTELQLCQRYYYQSTGASGGSGYPMVATGSVTGTTGIDMMATVPVPMRVTPSVSYNGQVYVQSGATAKIVTSIVAVYGGFSNIYIAVACSSATFIAGYAGILFIQNSSGNYVTFSSEL
jgi:hypothetical protein